ncbi:hypothetical protein HU200_063045 [Digitaria exilis]|uniref:DUF1618 domain-containing protein n=1 Tax=Digitaria exilis TaxID=1010633 RepID=A0A835AC42_9POAL|nr:hypothetical protein HU200_063045 [Digitaria exilis]
MGTSCDSPSSWVMLNCMGRSSDSVADAETTCLAESPVVDHSTGRHLRVSIGIARPPSSSYLYYLWAGSQPAVEGDSREYFREVQVIAAHGDSLLLETRRIVGFEQAYDYFVYTHSSQRPSLSRLRDFTGKPMRQYISSEANGILRRGRGEGGDGEIVVAQLTSTCPEQGTADLRLLRLGGGRPDSDWELKRGVPIVAVDEHGNDERFRQRHYHGGPTPYGHKAVPVGDRFMCWVDCRWGFFLCDMAEEEDYCSKLRYVSLPVMPGGHSNGNLHLPMYCGNLCCGGGGVGGNTVRYVSINPRCCCGGPGNGGSCARSRHAFTVTAWSMCLAVDGPLTWHKETMLDCEEIWAHPSYEGLPRVYPECPVISLHNLDVVCLEVREEEFESFETRKVWTIEVEMRGKAVLSLSVVRSTTTSHESKLYCRVDNS